MDILVLWVGLMLIGYVFGKRAESRHYASINSREKAYLKLPTTGSKYPIGIVTPPIERAQLVTGSVVISVDYFKRMLAGLRAIVGGPVQSYETLLDRARREAILRLKENCPGANQVINLRLETSMIGGSGSNVASVEVLAYATALYFAIEEQ
jgi:uncharacterized protein YbjQ (UPF0145 family)